MRKRKSERWNVILHKKAWVLRGQIDLYYCCGFSFMIQGGLVILLLTLSGRHPKGQHDCSKRNLDCIVKHAMVFTR